MQDIPQINNLHIEKKVKEQSKITMYNIVLNKCIEDIKYTNKFTDKTYVLFEVPNIIIGFNNYDYIACIRYLMNKFIEQKYVVEFIQPCYLRIDWGSNNNTKFNSKSIQQLIPTSNPAKLKKQTNELLKQFPNTSKVVFVYEDAIDTIKKNSKK